MGSGSMGMVGEQSMQSNILDLSNRGKFREAYELALLTNNKSHRNIAQILNEVLLLLKIGRHGQAANLLREVKPRIDSSLSPKEHRDYYDVEGQVELIRGNYKEASRRFRIALSLHEKMADSKEKDLKKVLLLTHLGQVIPKK